MRFALAAAAVAVAMARPGWAGCGVDLCPDPRTARTAAYESALDVTFRFARFALPGGSGDYDQAILRGSRRLGRWTIGGAVPFQSLRSDVSRAGGIGNAVAFAEIAAREPVSLGLQVELPGMKSSRGLSSGHAELLPYASAAASRGEWVLSARSGLRLSLSEDHHGGSGGVPLLIEPHGNRELVYRAGAAYVAEAWALSPEAYLLGSHSLEGADAGRGFLSAGLAAEAALGRGAFVRPFAEWPLTRPRRVQYRAGLAAGTRF